MKDPAIACPNSERTALDILEVIRKLRNELVNDFLDEKNLILYLSEQFQVMELSVIKMEFIRRDLKALLRSPVDTGLYRPLIEHYQASGRTSLSEGNEKLFFKEIENILKKYTS